MRNIKKRERLSNSGRILLFSDRSSGTRKAIFRDLVMLFYATTGRLKILKRIISSSIGLSSAEYSIVAALYRLGPKSGSRVKEIAEYLHMAPENATTAIKKLVKRNWIIKVIHPTDARAVILRLRPAARKRIDILTNKLRDVNEVWFREMTDAEIQLLIVFMERVLTGFDGALQLTKETFAPQAGYEDDNE